MGGFYNYMRHLALIPGGVVRCHSVRVPKIHLACDVYGRKLRPLDLQRIDYALSAGFACFEELWRVLAVRYNFPVGARYSGVRGMAVWTEVKDN